MASLKFITLALVSFCFFTLSCVATDVSYDGTAILINGERRLLISGAIHYPRSTPEMWPELMQKAKEGGLNTIETYVFWNAHEPRRREYNFQGHLDLVRFMKTVHAAGLYAVLRIGPYVCAEWNYGGFPIWLEQLPGVELRTDNAVYKNEMQNFTTLIVETMKQEKLFAPQGGPIILAQIENEYGNIQWAFGDAGKKYVKWCASLAESYNLGIPWIMCQQDDAPAPLISTCNGYYCDNWTPKTPNIPKMWTENWSGWYKNWGASDPHRPAEDVAYAVARFFQRSGTFTNYYMYHGGTNFGRSSGGPYITTTYDYDAPLDEYGNVRQPKWGHLKQLHEAILSMEKQVTYGVRTSFDHGNGVWATKYQYEDTAGCFISNVNMTDATVYFEGNEYHLPGWSVSVLPDCKQVVHNTAKITTQSSLMEKKANKAENQPEAIKWVWKAEQFKDVATGKKVDLTANKLLEQVSTTMDASDYLWYTTSVDIAEGSPLLSQDTKVHVNTTGHGLHAFVNGRFVGTQYRLRDSFEFVFEAPVQHHLKKGKNYISILSATVGLPNYGPRFEKAVAGIVGGPVMLINGNNTIDLSSNKWSYKIGLDGEDKELYSDTAPIDKSWHSEDLPTNRLMVWYKAAFKAPLGTETVVVDLGSMGKGAAWINGHSIGRYWANFSVQTDGCPACDYKGNYAAWKCTTGCGASSQQWYHVPRSFFKTDNNVITLFEEFGGNPAEVSFRTVTVGTACASVPEGKTLELSCTGGRTFSEIQFASYGDASGSCGSFSEVTCASETALSAVQKACLGKTSCAIEVSDAVLGAGTCSKDVSKNLVVQAAC
ncbi:beta-galactosidase 15-like [Aristolochia californica]|uniref:beta-galactosidase 15-like n=1 Tax=Aristolochia californica TaxID=171875 RepID=UPI0035E2528B